MLCCNHCGCGALDAGDLLRRDAGKIVLTEASLQTQSAHRASERAITRFLSVLRSPAVLRVELVQEGGRRSLVLRHANRLPVLFEISAPIIRAALRNNSLTLPALRAMLVDPQEDQ